jgi:hypothetical protein
MRVIANAKIASPKAITCSGFTFGTNASVDIIYREHICAVIAIIKIGSYGTIHKENFTNASQRMIAVNSQVGGEAKEEGWGINPVMKRHLELEIKTLQNAPRDPDKLERLLKVKQRQKEEAMHIEDTQRLVTQRLKC